jgi:hypothetical protein
MRRHFLAIVLVLSGCHPPDAPHEAAGSPAPPPAPAAPAPHASYDRELLRTMMVLATRHDPTATELDAVHGKLERGELTLSAYIDSLLAGDAFRQDVAPLVILRHVLDQESTAPVQQVLQHTTGTPEIYYLRAPCKPEQAVAVHPWWDLDHEVRVCPDSYQPETWNVTPKGSVEVACLAGLAHRQAACGCGPNLIACLASGDQSQAIGRSIRDEVRRTVSYVTGHDMPLTEIFRSNATYRDRNAEYMQVSQAVESHREAHPEEMLRQLASWPEAGQWAPRTDLGPGQNAGILTTPQIVYFMPDRRQRMSVIYDLLWCIDPDSAGATPQSLLSIKSTPDFQVKSAGWKELAARPLCSNCHARLDYGLQFYWGFQNMLYQAYYLPTLQYSGKGALYGDNIDDPRGEADLSPHGFAQLATSQPEFPRCMARDFGEYVLGDTLTEDQLDKLAAAANGTPRQLMRVALMQLAETWQKTRPPEPASAQLAVATTAPSRPEKIANSGAIKRALDDRCNDCHDAQPGRPDFTKSELERGEVLDVLDAVAFGRMPKKHPLPTADRTAFLDVFIDALWDKSQAETARAFFQGRMEALPAYRPEVVFELVHQTATEEGKTPWRMFERVPRSALQQVSPGLAAVTGLAAIEACRTAYKVRTDIDRCIRQALQLKNLAPDPR